MEILALRELLPLFIPLYCFHLIQTNNEKAAIKIMVFFIPFDFFPLKHAPFLAIGLNGMIIWAIWLGMMYKKTITIDWKIISTNVIWLYYFLIMGILLALINISDITDNYSLLVLHVSPTIQIINVSLFILTSVLFLKIIVNYIFDYTFQEELQKIFLATIFIHLFSIIISLTNISSIPAVSFLASYKVKNYFITRYSGLINDYELLIDYCIIIIALGLIYYNGAKFKSTLFIMCAVIVALLSGTRSFFVIFLIFVGSRFLINLLRSKFSIKQVIVVLFVLSIGYFFYDEYLAELTIFKRIPEAFALLEAGNIEGAANRDYSYSFPYIIDNIGITGAGSFYFWEYKNTYMVSHNLILAIYVKYGIIGIIFILGTFFGLIKKLYLVLRKSKVASIQNHAVVYLSALIALFIEQMKISFIRSLTPILIYAFLFFLLYSFIYYSNKSKLS